MILFSREFKKAFATTSRGSSRGSGGERGGRQHKGFCSSSGKVPPSSPFPHHHCFVLVLETFVTLRYYKEVFRYGYSQFHQPTSSSKWVGETD